MIKKSPLDMNMKNYVNTIPIDEFLKKIISAIQLFLWYLALFTHV